MGNHKSFSLVNNANYLARPTYSLTQNSPWCITHVLCNSSSRKSCLKMGREDRAVCFFSCCHLETCCSRFQRILFPRDTYRMHTEMLFCTLSKKPMTVTRHWYALCTNQGILKYRFSNISAVKCSVCRGFVIRVQKYSDYGKNWM